MSSERTFRRAQWHPQATRCGVAEVEAVDGVGEITHEIAAPQFSVGGDVETEILLLSDNALNVKIFEPVQIGGIGGSILSRFKQVVTLFRDICWNRPSPA